MFLALNLFCAISFLGYGLSCLTTKYMVQEFERYRVPNIRKLTGSTQILAAFGLVTGLSIPVIGILASGGLTLQMIVGFGVRLKIRDPFLKCLPALFFLILSAWLCMRFIERMPQTT